MLSSASCALKCDHRKSFNFKSSFTLSHTGMGKVQLFLCHIIGLLSRNNFQGSFFQMFTECVLCVRLSSVQQEYTKVHLKNNILAIVLGRDWCNTKGVLDIVSWKWQVPEEKWNKARKSSSFDTGWSRNASLRSWMGVSAPDGRSLHGQPPRYCLLWLHFLAILDHIHTKEWTSSYKRMVVQTHTNISSYLTFFQFFILK